MVEPAQDQSQRKGKGCNFNGGASRGAVAALADTGLLLGVVAARMGQGGSRMNGNVRGLALAAGTNRDDDRFWKAERIDVSRLADW